MTKLNKVLSLVLAFAMVLALAACGKTEEPATTPEPAATPAPATTPAPAPAEPVVEEPKGIEGPKFDSNTVEGSTAVYVTSTFGQKFSPFFYTTAYDGEVVDMTTGYLLAGDRGGAIMENGALGQTVTYNGTDYEYYGLGNVEIIENADGTVDYKLTMRNDVQFSDGEYANIDDVIFGIYVCCDPTYDGQSTIYALPIEGMEEYRSGMDTMFNLMLEAGEDNTDFTYWDEETQTAFWADLNQAGAAFAQEIIDYCCDSYMDMAVETIGHTPEEVAADESLQCMMGMYLWGFDSYYFDGATAPDYFAALCDAYGWDLVTMSDTESANSSLFDLMEDYDAYTIGVQTGDGAANISGIQKIDDYTLNVHMTEFDATAIYNMGFIVAPLHYYGDESKYDYDNNSFGFTKGDLSTVKSVTSKPLGCGPYVFESYNNGVVTLKANPYYWHGAPAVETMLFAEGHDADFVPGITTGTYDIAQPSISDSTLNAIKDANSNGEITGDTISTYLVDYRGYGYIGCNADLVNMGDPGSEESKALRKGFMTLMAVYRDTVVNSYYGDRAAVIEYPISNTSWAAPKPADEGYHLAYSLNPAGEQIFTASMSEEERYAAAKECAIEWFKAAGLEYDEAAGKFTGVDQTWEIMIPGDGIGDHPAYGVAVAASSVLEELGIKLQVNDVTTSTWNNALEGNTAMFWAAAWQASVDPDMTQVYHSDNAHGAGTNSNHYSVDDADLDELIVAGRKSADTEYRKSVYKEAMEIIMDWGCELPTYQRKDCTTVSTARIDNATIPGDLTPYWGWGAEVQTLKAVQ